MPNLQEASIPELRDGVEVFLSPRQEGTCRVLFLFLSNRRRLRIECKPSFATLLKELSKSQPLSNSLERSGLVMDEETEAFLSFLEGEGIVTLSDPLETELLPAKYVNQYKRQLYFLLDVLKSPHKAHEVQRRIFDAHITIFGLGAMGSCILQQLCMMGFRRFSLIDNADVEENDIARTPYRIASQSGRPKTEAAKFLVDDLAYDTQITLHDAMLTTQTTLDELVQGTSLIVNTTDQPYVGYTNIKISRYALQHDIPVFAAGGFDAHLSSLGELLIPHVTPCADCYATFFDESLKDWKPIPHPVKEREGWFGGLGSLSTFSASTAALEILAYFINPEGQKATSGRRGEFLFHDYSLDTFVVERDKECQACGADRDASI